VTTDQNERCDCAPPASLDDRIDNDSPHEGDESVESPSPAETEPPVKGVGAIEAAVVYPPVLSGSSESIIGEVFDRFTIVLHRAPGVPTLLAAHKPQLPWPDNVEIRSIRLSTMRPTPVRLVEIWLSPV